MRVVTLALVFCFAIAAVHGIPQRPPIITTNKDRRLIAKVIGSNETAGTSSTTEASVTSTTVAATSDEVNPEEEAEGIEEEAEETDPRHADSKQGKKLSVRPRQAKWVEKKQPAVETAEKIQPENKRNKKSTTTFCVEIRPSGSYKPFQVCEKEPAYEQASYGGAQQAGYKPQEYSAPYPPKASYGPPSPPAYAAPPKVNYPTAAPAYGAAKQEAASEAYAAPKPAHPSAAYGAAPAAASSSHSSGSSATSSGYGSPSSSSYRTHEDEQKARMMDDEAEDVESEMRSASYGDDYGYGGPSYGAPPVAYIPKKDIMLEKLGKKKAPHGGLVITCNPSLAGYAASVPSYGGMKYRNSGKSGRGGHKSPKSAYPQSSYSSSSSSGGHYGGAAAAGGYKGGYGASASGYGDHSAPSSGGYGGSSSYASSGYERPAQSSYGGYSAPAQPNYAPPQPSYAAPPAPPSYAPPPPPKYAPAPAPPSYAPPPKYAPAPAPQSYAPPPPPKYAPPPPPPKYAPAPSYQQPAPAPQQSYGPPPPPPAAYGGDQQAEESGAYVQPRPSAPAYSAPPAPPKYNAPAYVAPATYRASEGGDMKKMDEKSADEDGAMKQAMSMEEKQAKTLETMRKIAEQREAGMEMGRMAKVDDAIKKVEEKSEGGIEMGGEAGWSALRTDGRKAEDKGWEAKAMKDEDGEMEDDVKPNLV